MLGGAAYAAVSRDFRGVLHLRFYQRVGHSMVLTFRVGLFCRLKIVSLGRANGSFDSSNTDVVEKVNLLVAASQHGGTSVAEGSPLHVDRNRFVLVTFHGGIISC